MQIRATVTLRNEKMLAARERLGITQKQVAELADINVGLVVQLERFDYEIGSNPRQVAERVALALELPPEVVMPHDLEGRKFQHRHTRISEMELRALPDQKQAALLESPLEENELSDAVRRVLRTLSYREREILKMRFGLDGSEVSSLEEVGRTFKITRERVRQVEAKAIRKLQNPERSRGLTEFVEPAK